MQFSSNENSDSSLTPELIAYYADTKLRWRNIFLVGICTIGWSFVFTIVTPLMALKLLSAGFGAASQGIINAANSFVVAFLVMYFSWKSDHTKSVLGRRKPYLFLSALFIIPTILLFAFNDYKWTLLALIVIQLLFMDLKNSTFILLPIDCTPKHLLARVMAILGILGGIFGFLANRYANLLLLYGEWVPYVTGAVIMTITTFLCFFIVEPPVVIPESKSFQVLSTFKDGCKDKRVIILMVAVNLLVSFNYLSDIWIWLWAKSSLNLDRKDVFDAISWCSLINIALAYPIGWVIDRFGGLRIIVVYWILLVGCFILAVNVHDKITFTIFVIITAVIYPLYGAANIMIYQTAQPDNLGSVTSSTAFLKNLYLAGVVFISGQAISYFGNNYKVAFCIGISTSTLSLLFFYLHKRISNKHPFPKRETLLNHSIGGNALTQE